MICGVSGVRGLGWGCRWTKLRVWVLGRRDSFWLEFDGGCREIVWTFFLNRGFGIFMRKV